MLKKAQLFFYLIGVLAIFVASFLFLNTNQHWHLLGKIGLAGAGGASVGQTYYVTQSGAGSGAGTDVNNPMSIGTFNNKNNFVGGDTIYILDTITGVIVSPAADGSTGDPIVIRGDYSGRPGIIDGSGAKGYDNGIWLRNRSYLTIQNLEIRNTTNEGINFSNGTSVGVTIQNNYIHNVSTGITSNGPSSSLKFLNNHISTVVSDGIWFIGNNIEVAGNTIEKVSQSGPKGDGDCVQIGSSGSSNISIHDNNCDHSDIDSKSCVIAQGVTSLTIENNVCKGSTVSIEIHNSTGVLVRRNYILNATSQGIRNADTDGVYQYNIISGGCSLHPNAGAIFNTTSTAPRTVSYVNNTIYNVTGFGFQNLDSLNSTINFKNNIIDGTGSYLFANTGAIPINSDHNIFINGPAICQFTWGYTCYNSLASYSHAHSEDQNSSSTNPLFTNSSGSYSQPSDFSLQPTSPAINAGVSVGLTFDFAGNPISGLPDIGAFEYQGAITDATPPATPTGLSVN